MKKILLLLTICLIAVFCSYGQCVIYVCDQTGAFGAGFNNDNAPTTWKECTDYAIKTCKEKGGSTCTELYKSANAGWWGVISGLKSDGRIFFRGGSGYATKADAEREVLKKYKQDGGINADKVQVVTWYAYSNVK